MCICMHLIPHTCTHPHRHESRCAPCTCIFIHIVHAIYIIMPITHTSHKYTTHITYVPIYSVHMYMKFKYTQKLVFETFESRLPKS